MVWFNAPPSHSNHSSPQKLTCCCSYTIIISVILCAVRNASKTFYVQPFAENLKFSLRGDRSPMSWLSQKNSCSKRNPSSGFIGRRFVNSFRFLLNSKRFRRCLPNFAYIQVTKTQFYRRLKNITVRLLHQLFIYCNL